MRACAIGILSLVIILGCKGGPSGAAGGGAPSGAGAAATGAAAAALPVIRISKGAFPPEQYEEVRARLDAAKAKLEPSVRELRGNLHYWMAIDPVSSTMINVSVWETLADARQMETLQAMQALAGEFIALGVTFEQPITNSQVLWDIPPPAR
jgi:hypothetical protein